ncbi:MAG TPA: chemotaxis protein [Rhodopseudomonas sp.]|uniref:chemotaxis protein n=1 Tax=Rhodopseudomonas sp. TaxID=1078 RepID=UPI002ED880BC
MLSASPASIETAVTSIEGVGCQIEDVFARVGGDLGRAHDIFEGLNSDLALLGQELSGANIASASKACKDIAARLQSLAEALPAETGLLGAISGSATQASTYLKDILKHIDMITIIARSSRIEAASLDGDRGGFLSFTREASELAKSVQRSIVACAKDQEQLTGAIAAALKGQSNFEAQYRGRLLRASAELLSACVEIAERQAESARLADLARASAGSIGGAVGNAIVSLQAGDSTRQRLEHICRALRRVEPGGGLAPAAGRDAGDLVIVAPFVHGLQAVQLKDAIAGFSQDVGTIERSLTALGVDAAKMVGHGHTLCGAQGDQMGSFLAGMKTRLGTALSLIAACGCAKMAVDESISVLESMLREFRAAISSLGDTVIDITLIGMNAGLKASHLGERGRAFVVIANELKTTADRISAAAKLLGPVVDAIEQASERLKGLREVEEALHVEEMEGVIAQALGEIEAGNAHLAKLMDNLTRESAVFEDLVVGAKGAMAALGVKFASLSSVALRLEEQRPRTDQLVAEHCEAVDTLFGDLYLQYTMVKERDVHRKFSGRFAFIKTQASVAEPDAASTDDIFF